MQFAKSLRFFLKTYRTGTDWNQMPFSLRKVNFFQVEICRVEEGANCNQKTASIFEEFV